MTLPISWRTSSVTVVGSSHLKHEKPCQDQSLIELIDFGDRQVLFGVISDGAGSAQFSDESANELCNFMLTSVTSFLSEKTEKQSLSDLNRMVIVEFVRQFQEQITKNAEQRNIRSREFACTLLAALVDVDCAVFWQIGDGAMVIATETQEQNDQDCYEYVFWPQQGEYENTTIFATDPNSLEMLQYTFINAKVTELCMFSDGLQRLALNYKTKSVHSPFFKGFFTHLRKLTTVNSEQFDFSLERYLGSDEINSRTDDDKSLVLATRRSLVNEVG
jgi:hypothetical protein